MMLHMHFILLFIASVAGDEQKIKGGNQVIWRQQMSWVVAIFHDNTKYSCAGVLISNLHVLTAAHCFRNCKQSCKDDLPIDQTQIGIGFLKLTSKVKQGNREYFKVKEYTIHPDFDCCGGVSRNGSDIAIATLDRPVPSKFFTKKMATTALLPDETTKVTTDWLEITGWGETRERGSLPTTHLMVGKVKEMKYAQCREAWSKRKIVMPPDVICIDDDKTAFCQGDSGGPLLQKNGTYTASVMGVASFATSCGGLTLGKNTGSVYTDVRKHLVWIKSVAKM